MSIVNYIPNYIAREEAKLSRTIVTNTEWNELFNLNIIQGDNNSSYLNKLNQYLFGENGFDDAAITPKFTEISSQFDLKTDKTESARHFKAVTFEPSTGVFTFTREDNTTVSIDSLLEKVVTNFSYNPETQKLVLQTPDGTQEVSLASFIAETEFVDTSTIAFDVTNHVVKAYIRSGSITETMLTTDIQALLSNIRSAIENAIAVTGKINDMTVAATTLSAGSSATAEISEVSGHKHILFGIPKGDKGDPVSVSSHAYAYAVSDTAVRPADISFSISTVPVKGKYFWVRNTVTFDNGDSTKLYAASYVGADGAVMSVNGQTGTVVLDADDVGAIPSNKLSSVISVTLPAANWSNNAQTVSNAGFATSGFAYIVAPNPASFEDYTEAAIYAVDVSVAGQMTFRCAVEPTSNISVSILKVGV